MHAKRKRKLKQREEKRFRQDARKRASLDRLLEAMGLKQVFARLDPAVHDLFLSKFDPGLEVDAAEDSRDDAEIKSAVREIKTLVRRPLKSSIKGRRFELAVEDVFRGYATVVEGVEFCLRNLRCSDCTTPSMREFRSLMEEATGIIAEIDYEWIHGVVGMLMAQLIEVTYRNFRIDGRMITAGLADMRKPDGRRCLGFRLQLHYAEPKTLRNDGSVWHAFPCLLWGPAGLSQAKWNCRSLGIEGPSVDLPVFITRHAITRLHERLPLEHRESLLDQMMVEQLGLPVIFPADHGRYLVEARLARGRVGYFVAEVFPSFVLVLTFLFLTMQGTPEAQCLREKIDLGRWHIEHFKLDNLYTLVGSNIAEDPLLARLLSECGCGHLLSLLEPEERFDWIGMCGNRLKRAFDLQDAKGGFKIGRKWVRWSGDFASLG